MSEIVMYRGICVRPVDADKVANDIKENGLTGAESSTWKFELPDVISIKSRIEDYKKSPKTVMNVESKGGGLYASGSLEGATYYALKHNVDQSGGKTHGLIIKFLASEEEITIDGRDFLVTAFQLFDRESTKNVANQDFALKKLFGTEITKYFSESCKHFDDTLARIAWGRLACYDQGVISQHFKNKSIISGRHGTKFHSTFFVPTPILPGQIISVEPAHNAFYPEGGYTLDDFFAGLI